jgi:hypothetical protein
MPVAVPNSKPRLSSTALRKLIEPFAIDRSRFPVVVVGIRGYYLNTLGQAAKNDRGIYDDALFIDAPAVTASFNANTDPSTFRKGKGKGAGKGIACLKPGLWMSYGFGLHRGNYLALVQVKAPVTVVRDGNPDYEDTGHFGINIHKGSFNSTSSLGCQTIYPQQWDSFISLAKDQSMRSFGDQWKKITLPYVLIDNKGTI